MIRGVNQEHAHHACSDRSDRLSSYASVSISRSPLRLKLPTPDKTFTHSEDSRSVIMPLAMSGRGAKFKATTVNDVGGNQDNVITKNSNNALTNISGNTINNVGTLLAEGK